MKIFFVSLLFVMPIYSLAAPSKLPTDVYSEDTNLSDNLDETTSISGWYSVIAANNLGPEDFDDCFLKHIDNVSLGLDNSQAFDDCEILFPIDDN